MNEFEITKTVKYIAIDSKTFIVRQQFNNKDIIEISYENNGSVYVVEISYNRMNNMINILNSGIVHGKGSNITINLYEPNYKIEFVRTFNIKRDDDILIKIIFDNNIYTTIGGRIIKNILNAF